MGHGGGLWRKKEGDEVEVKEEPADEKDEASPAKQARHSRWKVVKREMDSVEHQLTHLPAIQGCPICDASKITRSSAYRLEYEEQRREHRPGYKWHLDVIGPVLPDIRGNRYLLVARDEATDFARIAPMRDKKSSTVTDSFKSMTRGLLVRVVRPDWGKEFEGRFESHCRRNDINIEKGISRRPQTHGRAERWHRTLEEGVPAARFSRRGSRTSGGALRLCTGARAGTVTPRMSEGRHS